MFDFVHAVRTGVLGVPRLGLSTVVLAVVAVAERSAGRPACPWQWNAPRLGGR